LTIQFCLQLEASVAMLEFLSVSFNPSVSAGIAGIGLSAGFVAFMERAAAKSASKLDEKVAVLR
jgi:hypothetical protein